MNVGIITPGRVYPGVNVAVSEVCIRENRAGNKVFGFFEGWRGLNHNLREEIALNTLRYDGGSILCTSLDALEFSKASEVLQSVDKLYCIGERSVQLDAAHLANASDVNVVGLLTSIERDVGVGFNTVVWENLQRLKGAHTLAVGAHAAVFVEVPTDEVALRIGMIHPLVDVVITAGSTEDFTFDAQHAYAMEGKMVAVVAERAAYRHVVDALERADVPTVVVPVDPTVMGAEPSMYDTVLARRMAMESCASLDRDFCKTAGDAVSFRNNNVIVV